MEPDTQAPSLNFVAVRLTFPALLPSAGAVRCFISSDVSVAAAEDGKMWRSCAKLWALELKARRLTRTEQAGTTVKICHCQHGADQPCGTAAVISSLKPATNPPVRGPSVMSWTTSWGWLVDPPPFGNKALVHCRMEGT